MAGREGPINTGDQAELKPLESYKYTGGPLTPAVGDQITGSLGHLWHHVRCPFLYGVQMRVLYFPLSGMFNKFSRLIFLVWF